MKLTHTLAVIALSASLGACIIAPPRGYYGNGGGGYAQVGVQVAPVEVAPAPYYAQPGPGYIWLNNVSFGWGWRHPNNGWHRGWR
jgi:hypothetical protein